MTSNSILILDFGSQVTQLIARRVREMGIYSEIWPFNATEERIREFNPAAIILSGGPASVTVEATPKAPDVVFELDVPVLGICYGQQTMVSQLGGEVVNGRSHEFGHTTLTLLEDSPLLTHSLVWMSHGDQVVRLPEGFRTLATTEGAPHAAIANERRRFYGVQFHPEVTHTIGGRELLEHFVKDVAGCQPDRSPRKLKEQLVAAIREQVGDGSVLCGLSGGVDSAVTALLLHEAIGDRVICVHVDHGLNRKGESAEVARLFRDFFQIPLHVEEAEGIFMQRLEGVSDPERKRKIIGNTFIEVFEEVAQQYNDISFLAQGTLYPDVIESVSFHGGPSATIKSHHNVGGLPEKMNLKLVEPLRSLFKDEVRALGREMGLPEHFVRRHPFPGPGLAIRIPDAAVEDWKLAMLRDADAIYLEEIDKAGLYDKISQAFAIFVSIRTVGVQGDKRIHGPVCALRAFETADFMTGEAYAFDGVWLKKVATRICNEVVGPQGQKFTRVVYDCTSKPPGTTEWE